MNDLQRETVASCFVSSLSFSLSAWTERKIQIKPSRFAKTEHKHEKKILMNAKDQKVGSQKCFVNFYQKKQSQTREIGILYRQSLFCVCRIVFLSLSNFSLLPYFSSITLCVLDIFSCFKVLAAPLL